MIAWNRFDRYDCLTFPKFGECYWVYGLYRNDNMEIIPFIGKRNFINYKDSLYGMTGWWSNSRRVCDVFYWARIKDVCKEQMEIVQVCEKSHRKEFKRLKFGEVFYYKGNLDNKSRPYLSIGRINEDEMGYGYTMKYNAVSLEDGRHVFVNDDLIVKTSTISIDKELIEM